MSREKVEALERQVEELRERLAQLEAQQNRGGAERLSIVVFSGSLDRQIAAFTIATAAAASGMEVAMFFTFWGFSALRDPKKRVRAATVWGRMFARMLPRGLSQLPLSQFNLGGLGPRIIRKMMSTQKVASLEEMLAMAADLEIEILACDMSMRLLGFSMEELIDYPKLTCCGAATFIARASEGKVSLFI